jgi:putative ABC transport system permease protein
MLAVVSCFKTASQALLLNKLRSFLTMLGIVIGVAAVIIIISVGAGAQSLILAQVKSLGTNLIGVLPGKSEETGPPASVMGIVITTLTYDDAMALADKNNTPYITSVVAYAKGVATVNWRDHSVDTNISGTTNGYLETENGEVEVGRFFNKDEEKSLVKIAVLGSQVKKDLFGESDAVGQKIKIKKEAFEVIGVMKKRGTVAFQNYDDQIFVPISTAQKLLLGVDHINLIRAKIDHEEHIDQAIADVKRVLRERHDITNPADDDFSVRSAAQALDVITQITNALKYFLAAIAALSLVVGGIGIMNIMLIAVTERTREIGLRKAIGATNKNILSQFLAEAISITLIGGILGMVLGVLISLFISTGAHLLSYEWDFIISPASIVLALSISFLVGLVFGTYPARRASHLDPIEALRYE